MSDDKINPEKLKIHQTILPGGQIKVEATDQDIVYGESDSDEEWSPDEAFDPEFLICNHQTEKQPIEKKPCLEWWRPVLEPANNAEATAAVYIQKKKISKGRLREIFKIEDGTVKYRDEARQKTLVKWRQRNENSTALEATQNMVRANTETSLESTSSESEVSGISRAVSGILSGTPKYSQNQNKIEN